MRNFSLFITLLFLSACNSIINETERVRKSYFYQNSESPTVTATDPADGAIGPNTQTYIDITFSAPVDLATVTVQSSFGACSGSLQISYDGFGNCLAGTIDGSANPRIRFIPTVFPKGLGLQIRASGAVTNPYGRPIEAYTSPTGFRLAAPCGGQNCFFSYSTPLIANAGTASWIFAVRSGPHSGKYLAYSSSGTTTTLIDPLTISSQSGKALCFTPNFGTYSFYVSTGALAGKEIIVAGGSSNATCIYDHATDTMSTGNTLAIAAGYGGFPLLPQSGTELGNVLMLQGGGLTGINRFNIAAGTFANANPLASTGGIAMQAHSIRLQTGTNIGQHLVFHGVASATTTWFNETTGTMTSGPAVSTLNTGSGSFEVTSGTRSGQVITVLGGNTTSTYVFNTTSLTGAAGGPAVSGNVTSGGRLLRQASTNSYDAPLYLHGAGFQSSIYNSATGNFEAGPLTTGAILDGSAAAFIPSTANGGAFLIVNGSSGGVQTPSTSVYFPQTNSFSGTRMPTNVPNPGSNSFVISGGPQNGRTLIVSGALSRETAVFDPLRFEMQRGPQLASPTTANALNYRLGSGRAVVFHGNAATYEIYDPASHSFSTSGGPSLSQPLGQAAVAFGLPGTSKFVVMHGGSATSGDMFDETTLAAPTGVTSPCAVGGVAFTLRYTNTAVSQQRQLVFCSGNTMGRFDHATGTFLTSLTLAGAAGVGIQGFVISGGTHNGKVLIIHGGGSTTTSLIDTTVNPETVSLGPSPSPACSTMPNAGAQIMPVTSGTSNGRVVLLPGAGSSASCIYDPTAHSFSSGNAVGNGVGFQLTAGALAFRTNGGLYPTSFIVLSGGNKNVWSAYVP